MGPPPPPPLEGADPSRARGARRSCGSEWRVWHPSALVRDLLEDLMDSAAGRADYADARHVRARSEAISTRNGAVDEVLTHDLQGVGVRVRVGGAWGFAATHELRRSALE